VKRRLIGFVLAHLEVGEQLSKLFASVNAHGEQIDALNDRLHDVECRVAEFDVQGAQSA
jgi:hypothetical protein